MSREALASNIRIEPTKLEQAREVIRTKFGGAIKRPSTPSVAAGAWSKGEVTVSFQKAACRT